MIQEFMSWYKEIMSINPTFASLVGVGLGGWVLMMARSLPKKMFNAIRNQVVTSLIMNNGGHGPNEEQCIAFMKWFKQQPIARFSRKLSLNSMWNGSPSPSTDIGAGFGTHFFFYKGRFFWFNRSKLDSSGTHMEKFQIEIHGLTRNTQLLLDLVEEFRVKGDDKAVSYTHL
ncbi:hypothetical protein, partial [Pseudomonas aeruginosa]|uniref:hypothetical protein n=1 Tax=Pseudomonas aeruginosa TaxID=287 RepID=UPI001CA53647